MSPPPHFSLAEWGVDEICGETPVNYYRLAQTARNPSPMEAPFPTEEASPGLKRIAGGRPEENLPEKKLSEKMPEGLPKKSEASASFPSSIMADISTATALAQKADSLDALKEALDSFDGCDLKKTARNTVFSDGNSKSSLMIIGEGPGQQEDIQAKPFVGASGLLLDKMLASIGFPERSCYFITNVIYWRAPGNRTPEPEELALCRPFLEKTISLIRPRLLFLLGRSAATSLLNRGEGITRLRGHWFDYNQKGLDQAIPTLASFHPSYLLRRPGEKKLAWQDLQALQKRYEKEVKKAKKQN